MEKEADAWRIASQHRKLADHREERGAVCTCTCSQAVTPRVFSTTGVTRTALFAGLVTSMGVSRLHEARPAGSPASKRGDDEGDEFIQRCTDSRPGSRCSDSPCACLCVTVQPVHVGVEYQTEPLLNPRGLTVCVWIDSLKPNQTNQADNIKETIP